MLERQAARRFVDAFILAGSVTNISLIAKGTIDSQRRSLLYRLATDNYVKDKSKAGLTHVSERTAVSEERSPRCRARHSELRLT